jgi:hypothetical protein
MSALHMGENGGREALQVTDTWHGEEGTGGGRRKAVGAKRWIFGGHLKKAAACQATKVDVQCTCALAQHKRKATTHTKFDKFNTVTASAGGRPRHRHHGPRMRAVAKKSELITRG